MKMRFGRLLSAICFLLVTAQGATAFDLGMITGSPKGTYYQFGLNLQELAGRNGHQLSVYNSKGSIENLYAVYKRPKTQMGIVQSDVLAFVSKVRSDPVLKRIAQKTKMIFPLYNEEVHLVGRNDIVDFDDLADKRVAIGKEGSGTYLTAKLLFEVSGVRPVEIIPIGTDEALTQIKSGNIDAMFYVAGYPVKLFQENISADDGLTVIPILNKSIVEFYPTTEIPANTYNWLTEPVKTVAVKAVLVSFDFKRYNCEKIGRFANIIAENMEWLKSHGHPKWKSVNLDYPLKGWEQYGCVKKYLKKKPVVAEPQEVNPILNAIKEML